MIAGARDKDPWLEVEKRIPLSLLTGQRWRAGGGWRVPKVSDGDISKRHEKPKCAHLEHSVRFGGHESILSSMQEQDCGQGTVSNMSRQCNWGR